MGRARQGVLLRFNTARLQDNDRGWLQDALLSCSRA